ncbi:hypothetical protein [Streptomyces sp.]|uniref:hypothetical protein n=1 Tax=Streptomyces sp. TaxID=1931 RepID=UPI0039C9E8D3
MQHDLQVAPDSLSWVIDAYTVVFAGALPLGSRVGRTDTGRFRTRARHGPTRGGSARARHGQRAHR